MTVSMRFNVDTKQARKRLKSIGLELQPVTLLKLVGERLLFWLNANIEAGGLERRWAPLRPNTLSNPSRGGSKPVVTGRRRLVKSFSAFGGRGYKLSTAKETVQVGTNVDYASYIHFGTKGPYPIPKNVSSAKVLTFWTVGGKVFAKRVTHPGLKARPLLPSVVLARRLVKSSLDAYMKRVVVRSKRGTS